MDELVSYPYIRSTTYNYYCFTYVLYTVCLKLRVKHNYIIQLIIIIVLLTYSSNHVFESCSCCSNASISDSHLAKSWRGQEGKRVGGKRRGSWWGESYLRRIIHNKVSQPQDLSQTSSLEWRKEKPTYRSFEVVRD